MRELVLVKVFKALSDETRIRLLKLLFERELCKEAGLVKDRRDGLWIYYSLNRKSFNQYVAPILGLLDGWLNDDEVVKKDREALKKAVRLSESESEKNRF